MKRKFFFWRKYAADDKKPWKDEKWILVLTEISEKRKELGLSAYMMRIGQLVADINAMPVATAEDVPWQVHHAFQDRPFKPPSNINEPFEEPDMEAEVRLVREAVHEQELKLRQLLQLVGEMSVEIKSQPGSRRGSQPASQRGSVVGNANGTLVVLPPVAPSGAGDPPDSTSVVTETLE